MVKQKSLSVKKGSSNAIVPSQIFTKQVTKNDGWMNFLTGMGQAGLDKRESTFYLRDIILNQNMLDNMYTGDGIVKTIVNLPADEMLSKGFEVENDSENYITSKLEELCGIEKLTEMIYWSRLYGGGLIVMGLDDGRELYEPVDTSTLRNINYLHVFDRYQSVVQAQGANLDLDMRSPNYGKPLFYPIYPYGTAEQIIVHHSRILRMDGLLLPGRKSIANQGWGESEIQGAYNQLKNYASAYNNAAGLIDDFVQVIFSMDGLTDMLNCESAQAVKVRFDAMNMNRSNYKMVVKDASESYEKITTNLGGIPELLDRFMMALSAVTRIPVALLFGRSAAGMNSTGELDVTNFYDYIRQQQQKKLKPTLEKLIRYMFLCKDNPYNGQEPDNWTITFNPLEEPSQNDEANFKKTISEIDEKYYSMGVLTADEIRESRFGSGIYSANTSLSETPPENDYSSENDLYLTTPIVNDSKDDETQRLLETVLKGMIEHE